MTSDREYVLSIHRDAFAATRGTRHYIARPGETVPRRISALTDTEAAAWTDAADRMKRARESWPLGAGLEAPPEEPTVHIALQYVGVRHRGMSFAIGDAREHVTYALPFIFPIGGTTQTVPVPERVIPSGEMPAAVMIDGDDAAVVPHEPEPPAPIISQAKMAPTFACPLCRIAADMVPGDFMAKVIAGANEWAWSYIDDEAIETRRYYKPGELEEARQTFAVAVGKAIEHLGRHGVAAEWHTADVLDKFPGTAYGAVVLRGLGAADRPSGVTRLTATAMAIRTREGVPFEVLFLADKMPLVPGRRAIVAELEPFHAELSESESGDFMTYETHFDAPLTIDTVALSVRDQIEAENEAILAGETGVTCDGCGSPATRTLGPFNVCPNCRARVAAHIRGEDTKELRRRVEDARRHLSENPGGAGNGVGESLDVLKRRPDEKGDSLTVDARADIEKFHRGDNGGSK